jgi:hypothetical protein
MDQSEADSSPEKLCVTLGDTPGFGSGNSGNITGG